MLEPMLLLRRTVVSRGATIELEISLPIPISKHEILVARRELDVAATALENCPDCETPHGHVHSPDCSRAPDGLIEQARIDAIADGMTP